MLAASSGAEGDALERLLASHRRWLENSQTTARQRRESDDVRRLLEQCKLILKHSLAGPLDRAPPPKLLEAVDALEAWIRSVQQALESEKSHVNTMEVMEDQLQKYKEMQETVDEEESNLQYVTSTGKEMLRKEPDAPWARELRDKLHSLGNCWDRVRSLLKERLQFLRKHMLVLKRFQACKDKLDSKLSEYNRLKEAGTKLAQGNKTKSAEDARRDVAALTKLWGDVQEKITKYHQSLKQSGTNYAEFRNAIMLENDWLDRLEKKLKRSPESAADAEEISENLDDLENFLRNHPDDRIPKIQQLCEELVEKEVLVGLVQHEAESAVKRWEDLTRQGSERQQVLENSIVQYQKCERQILSVQSWMNHMDNALQNRLDNDISAQDVPDELAQFKQEFLEKEEQLKSLSDQVDAYHAQNRVEAALRLDEQLQLMKMKFEDISAKLKRFQCPDDFEPKLGRISKLLTEVEQGMKQLDLNSESPDKIQDQLVQCMGRQLAESGEADRPCNLNQKLDSIKSHYNQLGAKVTESKSVLEQALRLARCLQKEMIALHNWMAATMEEIEKPHGTEDELKFAESLQMEMAEQNTRVQMLKEEALELLRQGPRYSKTVESELKAEALESKWNTVRKAAEQRRSHYQDLVVRWKLLQQQTDATVVQMVLLLRNLEHARTVQSRQKAALEQAARVGQEVSSLQQQARSLEQERGVPSAATQALLQRLLQLWNQAQGQIAVLHSPEPSFNGETVTEKMPHFEEVKTMTKQIMEQCSAADGGSCSKSWTH
ncbi:hypothetical protein HPB52_016920 [Rhipicephalus sanguineus]|uniref:Dystrophin n=1 Tax=Rhipicephalus sanguineus TaxID=34632 RepID=A0A9D4SSY1_RHISA|nr:hypothetical protein HPB52_016920 [Rhipicephalus sanguineus]